MDDQPILQRANRVFLRRVFDDGAVEEHEMQFDGSRIVGPMPPVDTSVVGRRWSDEFIVEWAQE